MTSRWTSAPRPRPCLRVAFEATAGSAAMISELFKRQNEWAFVQPNIVVTRLFEIAKQAGFTQAIVREMPDRSEAATKTSRPSANAPARNSASIRPRHSSSTASVCAVAAWQTSKKPLTRCSRNNPGMRASLNHNRMPARMACLSAIAAALLAGCSATDLTSASLGTGQGASTGTPAGAARTVYTVRRRWPALDRPGARGHQEPDLRRSDEASRLLAGDVAGTRRRPGHRHQVRVDDLPVLPQVPAGGVSRLQARLHRHRQGALHPSRVPDRLPIGHRPRLRCAVRPPPSSSTLYQR